MESITNLPYEKVHRVLANLPPVRGEKPYLLQKRRIMPDSNVNGDHKPFASIMKDAHGTAALLLAESLLHGLVKSSALSLDEAIDIVDIAAEVERELDATGVGPPFGDFRSLLDPIANGLRLDLNG